MYLEEEAEKYLRVNNLAYQDRPEDLALTTHICRGNYHSTYACTGAYDPVAPILFARENVDAFYLEFDDERSGGFHLKGHRSVPGCGAHGSSKFLRVE